MKFSVNIPVYNGAEYLHRSVNSVLAQSFVDYEINIVDDGSTDNTAEIGRQFAAMDSRINFYTKEKNEGLLMSRLFLRGKTNGEFTLYLDGDDELRPDSLAILNDKINRYGGDLYLFNFTRRTDGVDFDNASFVDNDTVYESSQEKRGIYERLFFTSSLNSMCFKAIKTELLLSDDTDYSPCSELTMTEDYVHSLFIVLNAKKIVQIPDRLYIYYTNLTGLSNSINLKKYHSRFIARKFGLKYIDESDYPRYAAIVMFYAMDCVKQIAHSKVSVDEKINAIKNLQNHEFYQNFALKNFRLRDLALKKKFMYILLKLRQYKLLIKILQNFSD